MMQRSKLFALGLLGLLAVLAAPAPSAARTNRALIVGASDYPGIDPKFWLKGPRNDAELVAAFLESNPSSPFASENVTVLAGGQNELETAPTLANIREAMTALAAEAKPGDLVYLHFSGHGSQSPSRDASSELDGLDEIFLPSDIGPWSDSVGTVENALVDDEIGLMIDAVREKGAHVFAVFDSCHSGTVTRGAPTGEDEEVTMRRLAPADLGVPPEELDEAEDDASAMRGVGSAPGAAEPRESPLRALDGASGGGFVGFYAAQTTETTPEMRLPAGKKGRKPHGLFTYTLFETLAQHPGMTYRQLGQEVLRRYTTRYMTQPTPLFEGDLDRLVFDVAPSKAVRQWPLRMAAGALSIEAGALHGLAENDVLAVVGSPVGPTDEALGHVRVASLGNLGAELVPAALAGETPLDPAALPEGAYVRKLSASMDFSLRVARPALDGIASATAERIEATLAALEKEAAEGLRLRLVDPGADADLRLAILPDAPGGSQDRVWLLPPTGGVIVEGLGQSPSVDLGGKSADEAAAVLGDSLARIARATNLLKVGDAGTGQTLDLDVDIMTKGPRQPDLVALDPAAVPRMMKDDQVHIRVRNRMDVPVDMNVLYVGSDFSIKHFFSGRVQPGDALTKGLLKIGEDSLGAERLILIATPAKPLTAVENLAFLAQDSLPTTRGTGGSPFSALLAEAGFGTVTRGAVALDDEAEDTQQGAILHFPLEVVAAGP